MSKDKLDLPENLLIIADKLGAIEEEVSLKFLEREDEIRGLLLAILSNSNILLLGPPGTAKSAIIREVAGRIVNAADSKKVKVFQTLMTTFSTIEDLLGPVSLTELENDRYIRTAKHSLKNSHIAFIDECFKGNAGALNVMLSAMNERIITEEGDAIDIPLLSLAGASNEVPSKEDGLDALVDRFNLKFNVNYLVNPQNWQTMLINAHQGYKASKTTISLEEIVAAREGVTKVRIPDGIFKTMWTVNTKLKEKKVFPSDRVWVWALRLLQAEAFMAGRNEVVPTDMVVLKDALWTKVEDMKPVQSTVYNVCQPDIYTAKEAFSKGESAYNNFLDSVKAISHDKSTPDGKKAWVNDVKKIAEEYMSKVKAANAQLTRLYKTVSNKDNADKAKTLDQIELFRQSLIKFTHDIHQTIAGA